MMATLNAVRVIAKGGGSELLPKVDVKIAAQ
jgi:hypothetical protein